MSAVQASPRPRPASPYVVPLSPSHQDNFTSSSTGSGRWQAETSTRTMIDIAMDGGEGSGLGMKVDDVPAAVPSKKRKANDGDDRGDAPVVDLTHLKSSPAPLTASSAKKARATSKNDASHEASGSDKENQLKAGEAGPSDAGDKPKPKAKPAAKRVKVAKESSTSKPVVELKKKKLVLHQEAMSLNKYEQFHALLGQYHAYLDRQPRASQLDMLREQYHPLVIMAGQESTAKNVKELAKVVASELKPMAAGTEDESQTAELSAKVLVDLLPQLFEHVNYGFHPSDFDHFPIMTAEPTSSKAPAHGAPEIKLPAGLTIWRWEAKDLGLIPNPEGEAGFRGRDAMLSRRTIREQARAECQRIAKGMDNITASALLSIPLGPACSTSAGPSKRGSISPLKASTAVKGDEDVVMGEPEDVASAADPQGVDAPQSPGSALESPEKPGKAAKKPKEETEEQRTRKLAKERKQEEAARKESEKVKAAKLMQGFFKPKAPVNAHASSSTTHQRQPSLSRESREASNTPNDFATTFLPFQALKHVDLAPVDPFKQARAAASGQKAMSTWAAQDFVADVIDCVTRRHTLSRPLRARSSDKRDASVHGKTPTLYATVSQLVARAQEVADPREVYDNLKDLAKFPRKMLKFAEDLRPPYAGTWSRPSTIVGPRSPFAMDPFLDYSVDEGVDWEEDNPEEDINEQVEEDSDEDSEDNSIMGDWMVGDDEIEFEEDVELSPGKVRAELPMSDAFAMEDKAARAKAATEAAIAKRKVDKLVPFIKGPIWEAKYSVAAWEGFEAYKIGFLNDTPCAGIDPFLWQSTPLQPDATQGVKQPHAEAEVSAEAAPAVVSGKEAEAPLGKEKKEKKEKPRPKGDFPPDKLVEFFEHIKTSDKPKGQLLPELHAKFRGNPSQALMTWVFEESAVRPAIKGGLWTVKEEAWARAHNPGSYPGHMMRHG